MIRLSKRSGISIWESVLIRVIAVAAALLLCLLLTMLFTGQSMASVFKAMWYGSFGTKNLKWKFFMYTMLLSCIAVGLAPAFKMHFWNIGAEGQLLMGGLGALILMKFCWQMPNLLLLLCMALTAIVFGAIWGMIPGFFKAKWNANETLFTLMMNYIATQLVLYFCTIWEGTLGTVKIGLINGNRRDPASYHKGWIGQMFRYDAKDNGFMDRDYYWLVLIVAVVVVLMWAYLRYTKQGYEITVVGDSEKTAQYAGIRVNRVYVRSMAISGGVEGFAGFLAVAAVSRTLTADTAGGRGFTAIIIAWLAHNNPFLMVVFAALYTFLELSGNQIASVFPKVNNEYSKILTGIVLFFVLGCEFFTNYRLHFARRHALAEAEAPKASDEKKDEAKTEQGGAQK